MFFHELIFARSQGSCLNTKPLGRVFIHHPRVTSASVNAMKKMFVINILAYLPDSNKNHTENAAKTLKYPSSYTGFF